MTAGRKLLVTGGAGFIGANFVRYWSEKYPADGLVVLDALTYAGNPANLEPVSSNSNYRFVHGNILDPALLDKVMQDEAIDTIVHFAAESHVDRSIHEPDAFIQTNVIGTNNLLMAARKFWIDSDNAPSTHLFHHVSTDEVYGTLGPGDPAFTEQTLYAPNSPYAASKVAGEALCHTYNHLFDINMHLLRFFTVYGPRQRPEMAIHLFARQMLNGESVKMFGDGRSSRDYTFIADIVDGISSSIENCEGFEVLNLGGSRTTSLNHLVESLAKRLGVNPVVERAPDQPGDVPITFADVSQARQLLGYDPKIDIETGIDRFCTWLEEQERP